jgi:hypothetical protein
MSLERIAGGTCDPPFPVYPHLAETLAATQPGESSPRDATVAHVLGTCAGYAYADVETVATMMTRLGLERHACVRISLTVDAMFIFSTAYLVQSRCGRVVILCYRGTEPGSLGNWLGDAEVGTPASTLSLADGAEEVRVHAGFYRNVRATWWAVMRELNVALERGSLLGQPAKVEHPLEALYVTGHSLGGAMAVLFALAVCNNRALGPLAEKLRAVYTFGQPMAVAAPLPEEAKQLERKLVRHVSARDPVPALPPARWGPFVHLGQEYRYAGDGWQRARSPVAQLKSLREIPRSAFAFFAGEKHRASSRYALWEHAPHHYVAALRPSDRVSEFGD